MPIRRIVSYPASILPESLGLRAPCMANPAAFDSLFQAFVTWSIGSPRRAMALRVSMTGIPNATRAP